MINFVKSVIELKDDLINYLRDYCLDPKGIAKNEMSYYLINVKLDELHFNESNLSIVKNKDSLTVKLNVNEGSAKISEYTFKINPEEFNFLKGDKIRSLYDQLVNGDEEIKNELITLGNDERLINRLYKIKSTLTINGHKPLESLIESDPQLIHLMSLEPHSSFSTRLLDLNLLKLTKYLVDVNLGTQVMAPSYEQLS